MLPWTGFIDCWSFALVADGEALRGVRGVIHRRLLGVIYIILRKWGAAFLITSCAFAVMSLAGWRTAWMLLRRCATRRTLIAFALVLAWDFLHLSMVRHFGGGNWGGDWHEHYDRTRYFLHELPNDVMFLGTEAVPARPPMMNLMAAFFCRQIGMGFEQFSAGFLFLNAWAFLPCCLLLRSLAPRAVRLTPVLSVLFMLNSSIMENSTLTVTKELAAGLVVLGVSFYLSGWRSERRGTRTIAAALALAAAVLVHYSAVPFAIAVGLHSLLTVIYRRDRLQSVSFAALSAGSTVGGDVGNNFILNLSELLGIGRIRRTSV